MLAIKRDAGFTLIEMIVVIGVIAILSAMLIAIVDPVSQFQKARDAQRKSDLSQVQKELEQYYQDTGHYPVSTSSYQIVGLNSVTVAWGTSNTNNWPYANQLPKDPDTTRTYVYFATGQSYWLYASLERSAKDPSACNAGGACANLATNGIVATKCGSTCNYGVSSPNTTP